jgi:anti-sigma factor RsiW
MEHISDRLVRAETKLERIKQEGKEVGHRALFLGAAAAVGAGYGVLNTQKGGTPAAPYSVAGKAPLDAVLAVAGVAGALLVRKSIHIYPVLGAAASAVGLYTSRLGAAWESQRMSGTTPAATTTSGMIGHGMRSRQFGPGVAQRRHSASQAYVDQYVRR